MNKFLKLGLFLCLGVFIIFQSCVKKNFDFDRISEDYEWDPAIAVPVAKASLSIRDIVQDYDNQELFIADESGFLYLMYHKHIFSAVASQLIYVPNQVFPDEPFFGAEYIALGFNSSLSTATVSHTSNQAFNVIGANSVDSIVLTYALLNITCISGLQHTGQLVVTMPDVKKNGVPYSKTIDITDASGSFTTSEYFNDLGGYTIDLSSGLNQIPVQCALTYNDSGSPVNAGDQTIVGVNLSSIEYDRMYGDFGQDTLTFQDTIKLEIFNQAYTGHANFVDPRINVYFNNSYGMPISMLFGDLTTYTGAADPQNQTFPFADPTVQNPFPIGHPNISQVGQSVASAINLDKNNSNVVSIINTTPEKIIFQVTALTNHTPMVQNFITNDSRFDMDMEVVLPLYGNASFFSVEDTADLDFEALYGDIHSIEYIKIRINVDNGMPTDVKFQLFFADSNKVKIDSLFTELDENSSFYGRDIVSSGKIDGTGKVYEKTHKFTEMKFERERLKNFKYVRYIMFRGWVKTTNGGNTDVRFYSDYAVDMKVGILAKFNFDQSEDYDIDYTPPPDTTQN